MGTIQKMEGGGRTAPDLLTRLETQRSNIVQGFLWILAGAVVVTFILNGILLGSRLFTVAALLPNLVLAALIGTALWLNGRKRFRLAVWLMIAVILITSSLPPLVNGVEGSEVALFLFFAPVVMAGLLLDRLAVLITSAWTLLVVLGSPVLHGAGLEPAVGVGVPFGAWLISLQFAIVYITVAFFLERFGATFQSTLRKAIEREVALNEETKERLRIKETLLEEQSFSDAILGNLPGIFYVIDEEGKYFKWNRNFESNLGYAPQEMKGLNPLDLVEDDERAHIEGRLADVFEKGYTTTEAQVVTKDGKRIPYLLNGTRVRLGGKTYLAGVGIDRTEVAEAEAKIEGLNLELHKRLERIGALHEIDKAITGSLDLDFTLNVVLEQVTRHLQIDAAAVLLYKPETDTLRFGASLGLDGVNLRETDLRLGEGLAGAVALGKQRVFVNDAARFRDRYARLALLEDKGFTSYVAVPLLAKGKLNGVLELYHRSRLDPTDEWFSFLTTLATQAAIALDSASLFESLERTNADLRIAYDTTIEGWASALDLRDEETEGHSRRVTDISVKLARRLGVRDDDLVNLRRGSLLHDIGKMAVPDGILLKPGKLSPEEWQVMKQHTVYAYNFLAPIPFLRDALDIPYSHHEKWDGSGYPQGLKGEAIPLAARIFAVVDVYDALTSDRPYRPAWTRERALDYIREEAGSHFDPSIADAFLEMMAEELPSQSATDLGVGDP